MNPSRTQLKSRFAGTYRVINPRQRVSSNGCPYISFAAERNGQRIHATAWQDSCQWPVELAHGEIKHLTGTLRSHGGRDILKCHSIRAVEAGQQKARMATHRIRAMWCFFNNQLLREFLAKAFGDPRFRERFLSVPASLHHHHGYSRGLFIHSVEVAWHLFQQPGLAEDAWELAVVAGLLHDAGKTRTLTGDMSRTETGRCVDHDDLTFEVLAAPLSWLDRQDEALAAKLRYLLTWSSRKDERPRYIEAEYIKFADHVSAAGELG